MQLSTLENIGFDPSAFPDFDEELQAAMVQEIQLLFHEAVQQNQEINTILNSDTVWVNQRLASHYGIDNINWSNEPLEIAVEDLPRGGILESAAFLAITSHPSKTSPTKRGRWILEQLLCQPPEEPPDNVETDVSSIDESASLQEMLAAHADNPACASCHLSMDPLGISCLLYTSPSPRDS